MARLDPLQRSLGPWLTEECINADRYLMHCCMVGLEHNKASLPLQQLIILQHVSVLMVCTLMVNLIHKS